MKQKKHNLIKAAEAIQQEIDGLAKKIELIRLHPGCIYKYGGGKYTEFDCRVLEREISRLEERKRETLRAYNTIKQHT
jgi:hypothetical protein